MDLFSQLRSNALGNSHDSHDNLDSLDFCIKLRYPYRGFFIREECCLKFHNEGIISQETHRPILSTVKEFVRQHFVFTYSLDM